MQSILRSIVFASVSFLITSSANAYLSNSKMPACLDGPDEMRIDNARVLKMKTTTKNAYLDRGFVEGTVVEAPTVKNGHDHFVISIGPGPRDTLEIVYNKEFGSMPTMNVGDNITVCGDYITSTARTGQYDPSPEGALIHWIHFNPATRAGSMNHEHGFVMVGNNLVGFDDAPAGAWDGRIIRTSQPNGGNNKNQNGGDDVTVGNKKPTQPRATDPVVQDNGGAMPAPTRNENPQNNPQTRKRSSDNRGQTRRPYPGRWKPCRTLQECSDRNGEF